MSFESEEILKVSAVVAALVEAREDRILSYCKDVIEAAFPDSIGRTVIAALLAAHEPLSLNAIAFKCDYGKRSVLPEGKVRIVVDGLARAGMLVNEGSAEKPRYVLDHGDQRVQILTKIYGSVHI